MVKAQDIITRFEQFAPQSLAMPGDPVGVQIGDVNKEIHRVLVTLDVRPEVVKEAQALNADMIFAHHPVMFQPAHNLDYRVPQNALYAEIVRDNLLVYAAHTNLDRANGGMNDWLSLQLGLTEVQPFIESGDAANMGRIGTLEHPMSVREFAGIIKDTFELGGLRVVANDLDRSVQRVAVLGGDGGKFFLDAKAAGADVYVTGDVYYHVGHDMLAADLPVIDPGHHIESVMKGYTRDLLTEWAQENDWQVQFISSTLSTDPYTFM